MEMRMINMKTIMKNYVYTCERACKAGALNTLR